MQIPDENERASLYEAAFTEESLAAVRARNAPQTHPDFDGEHCVDCDEAIPPERLAAGRVRCTRCQSIQEQRSKMYAGPALRI